MMRERGISYLVGTPKGRLTKLEQSLLSLPWDQARPSVQVKLLPHDGELYVWARAKLAFICSLNTEKSVTYAALDPE